MNYSTQPDPGVLIILGITFLIIIGLLLILLIRSIIGYLPGNIEYHRKKIKESEEEMGLTRAFLIAKGESSKLLFNTIILLIGFLIPLIPIDHVRETFLPITFIILIFALPIYPIILYRLYKKYKVEKSMTIIPEFKPDNDVKFYEIGTLFDGTYNLKDILAEIAFLRINGKNEVKVLDELGIDYKKEKLSQIFIKLVDTNKNKLELFDSVAAKINDECVSQKFFVFNPVTVGRFIISFIIGPTLIIGLYFSTFLDQDSALNFLKFTDIVSGNKDFAFVIGITLASTFIRNAMYFLQENYNKTKDLREHLLGFRIYLKTTEFYKIQNDPQTFEKAIPYFISLGVREEYFDDMIEYVDKNYPPPIDEIS